MQDYQSLFPYHTRHPDVIYFDNAATSQKPQSVIDAVTAYASDFVANPYRGRYTWVRQVERRIEQARHSIAAFINAEHDYEVFFTSGATESLSLVFAKWGLNSLADGDEVLYCPEDHVSFVAPLEELQKQLQRQGKSIMLVPYQLAPHSGCAEVEEIAARVTDKTRLVCISHIHNIYGLKNEIGELRQKIGEGIRIFVDASQSIGHSTVDVQQLGADFLAFSGHKMFALDGTGVLYVRASNLPALLGSKVGDKPSVQNIAGALEVGTMNVAGIVSLQAAIEFIQGIGLDEISYHSLLLTQTLLAGLRSLPGIELLPGAAHVPCAVGYGIISFRLKDVPSTEIGFFLDEQNMYVRTGTHCSSAQTVDSIRVSMHINNTRAEVERFIAALGQWG